MLISLFLGISLVNGTMQNLSIGDLIGKLAKY